MSDLLVYVTSIGALSIAVTLASIPEARAGIARAWRRVARRKATCPPSHGPASRAVISLGGSCASRVAEDRLRPPRCGG
jgi:hypothetical protein